LARVNNADFLLTGDKDLLVLERYEQTRITSFTGFMAIIRHNKENLK